MRILEGLMKIGEPHLELAVAEIGIVAGACGCIAAPPPE